MKILLHTRTADQFDWSHHAITVLRLPTVGEYIKVPADNGDARHYEIRMIVHITTGEIEAEVYCLNIGPTQIGRLGWKNTLGRDRSSIEEPVGQSVKMLTVAQAAKATNMSDRSIHRLIKDGRLTAVACGTGKRKKNYRISVDALAAIKPAEEPEQENLPTRRRRRRVASSGSARECLSKY